MKIVILDAGGTKGAWEAMGWNYGFPPNSKPKCLYHIGGKTPLEMQIKTFNELGFNDIRIVVGYHKDDIIEYCKKKGFKVEFKENKHWETDAIESIRKAVEGVKDSMIIIWGDVLPDIKVINAVLKCPEPLVGGDHIWKIDKSKVHIFKDLREPTEQELGRLELVGMPHFTKKQIGKAPQMSLAVRNLFHLNNYKIIKGMEDLDFYNQTDESRNKNQESPE